MPTQKTRREERETPGPLAPLFVCFFLPLGLPCVNWASQGCCLFYLRSSLRSLDLFLFYFWWLFPSLSFSHHHSGLLFPILTTQHNHLILCRPLLLLPSIFPSIRVFSNESALASGDQSIGVSALASFLPMNTQT